MIELFTNLLLVVGSITIGFLLNLTFGVYIHEMGHIAALERLYRKYPQVYKCIEHLPFRPGKNGCTYAPMITYLIEKGFNKEIRKVAIAGPCRNICGAIMVAIVGGVLIGCTPLKAMPLCVILSAAGYLICEISNVIGSKNKESDWHIYRHPETFTYKCRSDCPRYNACENKCSNIPAI